MPVNHRSPEIVPERVAPFLSRWLLVPGLLLLAGLAAAAWLAADYWIALPPEAPLQARYVGRNRCIECHQDQAQKWHGSHHDLAMDRATAASVLGDFDGATLEHHGITSRMFRRDGKFMVHTEGPDGEMADFEVKYVFGVDPLQQYMVEFDRTPDMPEQEIARLQVLRISWDTHRQRWFYLDPPDVTDKLEPTDDLHWTGIAQRWNTMCAECHSTNLQKNYDPSTGIYHTTFSEIDVSCEACHGPGSVHVELAESPSPFWDRQVGYGLAKLKTSDHETQIETCAQCHSRRRILHPDFRPGREYHDYFTNELLQPDVYHADGQIQDEVYVYGSYVQSKMYHKGIRCTDCHDPHSTRVRYQDNRLCTSCHQHPAGKYDSPVHHHHAAGSDGARCVECHMPETVYMEVDARRDHSLRVPRPDLSVELGTPNACTRCHLQQAVRQSGDLQESQSAEAGLVAGVSGESLSHLQAFLQEHSRDDYRLYQHWLDAARGDNAEAREVLRRVDVEMRDAVDRWYGQRQRPEHFARALDAARKNAPNAAFQLINLLRPDVPAIVRATALRHLGEHVATNREAAQAVHESLNDPDPQVRAAAVASLGGLPSGLPVQDLLQRLSDPVRAVRQEAVQLLCQVPSTQLDGQERRARQAALEELEEGLSVHSDRAGTHLLRGLLYEQLGELNKAVAAYELGMKVEPRATGPRTNLADLLERLAESERQAAQQLARGGQLAAAEQAAERANGPQDRIKALREEELALLARDARYAPDNAAVQHRYGLALYLAGRWDEAEQVLRRTVELDPSSDYYRLMWALLLEKRGALDEALVQARRLVEQEPTREDYLLLLARLYQRRGDEQAARQVLERAARLRPGGPTVDELFQAILQ